MYMWLFVAPLLYSVINVHYSFKKKIKIKAESVHHIHTAIHDTSDHWR